MPSPQKIAFPKNQWYLIVQNIRCGNIEVREWRPEDYYVTYRINGDPAPIGDHWDIGNSKRMNKTLYEISCAESMDIYIYCKDYDGTIILSL